MSSRPRQCLTPAGPWAWGIALALLVASPSSGAAAPTEGAPPLGIEALIGAFGLTDAQVASLRGGEIVAVELPRLEGNARGLAAGVVMRLRAGARRAIDAIVATPTFRISSQEGDAHGVLDVEAGDLARQLEAFDFGPDGDALLDDLAESEPGDAFNLSSAEYRRIRRAAERFDDRPERRRVAVLDTYRDLLADRLRDYLERGLDGIAPYARGEGEAIDPARDLETALTTRSFVRDALPEVHRYLLDFPSTPPDGVTDRFYWVRRTIDGRPGVVLVHGTLFRDDRFALVTEREIYVSHTYDALLTHWGLAPADRGDAVAFYVNRTYTERVTGFGSSIAERLGRDRLVERIREAFESFRDRVPPD